MAKSKKSVVWEPTYPQGPILPKWYEFAYGNKFREIGMMGPTNTGKTNAIITGMVDTAINYPGSKQLLSRYDYETLYKTTLGEFLSLVPKDLYHFDKETGVITFESVDGNTPPSTILCFGLGTGNYETKLKTLSFMQATIDEADELGRIKLDPNHWEGRAMDYVLTRIRQQGIYHRQTYHQRITDFLNVGHISDYEEGLALFGITGDQVNRKEKGFLKLRHAANDGGNNWYWKRMVDYYGDRPHPPMKPDKDLPWYLERYPGVATVAEGFTRWVEENVGIVEVFTGPEFKPEFYIGSKVFLGTMGDENVYDTVKSLSPDRKILHLESGRVIPSHTATLVSSRKTIYAFTFENESRNFESTEMLYLADIRISNWALHGLTYDETGLLIPEFSINTHVLEQKMLGKQFNYVVVLDYNVDVCCAIIVAQNRFDDIVIEEYEGVGGSSPVHADEISKLILYSTGLRPSDSRIMYIGDPNMWKRDQSGRTQDTIVADFEKAFGKRIIPANTERSFGINALKTKFSILPIPVNGKLIDKPSLWVMDNCQVLINSSKHNDGLLTMTYETWRSKKRDHLIDVLRYYASTAVTFHIPGKDDEEVLESNLVYR